MSRVMSWAERRVQQAHTEARAHAEEKERCITKCDRFSVPFDKLNDYSSLVLFFCFAFGALLTISAHFFSTNRKIYISNKESERREKLKPFSALTRRKKSSTKKLKTRRKKLN